MLTGVMLPAGYVTPGEAQAKKQPTITSPPLRMITNPPPKAHYQISAVKTTLGPKG